MHQPSSIKLSSQSQRRRNFVEWLPSIGVMGVLFGCIIVSINTFRFNAISCSTETAQPCTSELLSTLQPLLQTRMFFSNLTWQSELVTNGYSPDLPSTALSFPDTLILRVRELVPAYQLVTANEQLSINSLGFLVSSSRMPDQTYQFVLSDPNLALQIETARSVPENLHASLLTTIQKLNSLSINFSSLQLVADSTLLIELTPQLWALTDSSDPASLDRLQQIMTSNQLPLEEGQLYELDTRFSHPVLRKRL